MGFATNQNFRLAMCTKKFKLSAESIASCFRYLLLTFSSTQIYFLLSLPIGNDMYELLLALVRRRGAKDGFRDKPKL